MSDLLSSFWGKSEKKNAGGDSLERSEGESPPASPPVEGAPPTGDVQAERPSLESLPATEGSPESVLNLESVSTVADDGSVRPAGSPSTPPVDDATSVDSEVAASEFLNEDWDGPYEPIRTGQDEPLDDSCADDDEPAPLPPNLKARRKGTLSKRPSRQGPPLSAEQKLLLLDIWQRSGLPARDFGGLVNVSRHTLYAWKKRFEQLGPAGLMEQPRGQQAWQSASRSDQAHDSHAQESPSRVGDASESAICWREARHCRRAQRQLPACSTMQATRCRSRPHGLTHRRSAPLKGRNLINSGRPICLPSCSSVRIDGSTWWRSWTTTVVSSQATDFMPASRLPWSWRYCGQRLPHYGSPEEILTDNGSQVHHLARQESVYP